MDIFTETTSENDRVSIPFVAYEATMSRFERTIKRLWVLCIILIVLLAVTNGAWIYYESQFEDVVTTNEITQDVDTSDGGDAVINDGVHINNGESKTDG